MSYKQHRKWHEAQTKKQIENIRHDYPPEKVRAVLDKGLTGEQAAASLGLDLTDSKILLCLYRCTGDLQIND